MILLCCPVRAGLSILLVARESIGAGWDDGSGAPPGGRRARAAVPALVIAVALCSLLAAGVVPASADSCPNAQFRVGTSASLPDCRAYEQVSPVDKNNYGILYGNDGISRSGAAVTYDSQGAFAGSLANPGFQQYVSSRGASGWSTTGISPLEAPTFGSGGPLFLGFSGDLSRMIVDKGDPAVDGATAGAFNLYRRETDGSLDLLTIGQVPAPGTSSLSFAGASTDYSQILFEDAQSLCCNAPTGEVNLYEWVSGQLRLVSTLPDGTPDPNGGVAGSGAFQSSPLHAISTDGARVFWSEGNGTGPGPIYLNQNGTTTTEISASQCTSNPSGCTTGSGSGTYWTASTDGSSAFLTSNQTLTNDSTASFGAFGDLYEYDVATSKLTDLSVDTADTGGARVQGVVGASEEGSYVYFVATGALATGATAGQPNLYVRHSGTTTFIATLNPSDAFHDWNLTQPFNRSTSAQVSADGLHLLFTSTAQLSGSANVGHSEVYRYSARSGQLNCVSCSPSGAAATGNAVLSQPADLGIAPTAALLQTVNNMSSDGSRVFFETSDALLPQDTNGTDDVYEWEADGNGGCLSAVENGGCLYLISTGQSGSPSHFENSTPSGDDVFSLTDQQLVGQDTDANVDLYDARVDGGLASQNPPAPPTPCSGDVCLGQAAPAPPIPAAATVTFVGPGNGTAVPGTGKAVPAPVRVKVLSRAVHGPSFVLRVRVPAKGRIKVSGTGIRTVQRSVGRAGTYRLRVGLTVQMKRVLKRKGRLELGVRLHYTPAIGAPSSAKVSLTVKA